MFSNWVFFFASLLVSGLSADSKPTVRHASCSRVTAAQAPHVGCGLCREVPVCRGDLNHQNAPRTARSEGQWGGPPAGYASGGFPSRCSIWLPPVTVFSGELIAECNARNVGGYSTFFFSHMPRFHYLTLNCLNPAPGMESTNDP